MLWRFLHSSSFQSYLHGEDPCSLVLYSEKSEKLCAAICGRLLSHGFDIILVAINTTQHNGLKKHLQTAYPRKYINHFDAHTESSEETIQLVLDTTRTRNVTLLVSCIDANVCSPLERTEPLRLGPSINIFLDIQKLVIPLLTRNEPSGLLLTAGTLSPTFSAGREFLESYTSGLSRQLQSLGRDKVHVTLMDYYGSETKSLGKGTIFSPSVDVLADSILHALG
ncbi:uncharacterized protein FOMMEDRAFT_166192 [Fomitiporia mediterranea MF3/22]|uniref:uncharacterized protein n=1 Tax=Fomitiporia mediterranea (strain MF3/22) TaxID=694068 RepID=UPI0004408C33|nr:uncharacterized protein FOMMEDRAFT_166192 [Fomitiporia mediterranea MF3/22]EJD05881.1 hypothetical protein FOMMEDRAFT_166192 [Fomitiporia mediterranea MF3/22]